MFDIFSNFGPASDLPDVGNVLDDDTVGGAAGTFQNVNEADVATGTSWGEDGTEFTGTGEVGIGSIFFLQRR